MILNKESNDLPILPSGLFLRKKSKNIITIMITISFVLPILSIQNAEGLSKTGVIIPLYSYPDASWESVVEVKTKHPSIPIVVAINPNNGPGSIKDDNIFAGVEELRQIGVIVLGYVPTQYGARNSSDVVADIDSYKNWYNVDGIKFDEMANSPGYENYYSDLNSYAKSLGFSITFGNPGTDTLPSYVGTVDNITIFENSFLPDLSSLGGWHLSYDKMNFSAISYGVKLPEQSFVTAESQYVGYLYITDDTLPNPFDSTSSYLETLVSMLDVCTPPFSGDWIVTTSCVLSNNFSAPSNVIVQNNSVLTIPKGVTLDLDFNKNHLLVQSNSGVLIRAGGSIK